MRTPSSIASPPDRPLLVYDGECQFCLQWIGRWRQATGDSVQYLPSQAPEIARQFPEISQEQFEAAVVLIEPDGRVFVGAWAALRALSVTRGGRWALACYERWPWVARIAEASYRAVATHRGGFSLLTRLTYGRHVERPSHRCVIGLFLRALGLIYLTAFLSLWSQIDGLVGENGIVPAQDRMESLTRQIESQDMGTWERVYRLPTVGWWTAGNATLHAHCAVGSVVALLLVVGIAPAPCLFLLWAIYLSLSGLCGVFLNYQWDTLLLETGFLAMWVAPMTLWPFGRGKTSAGVTDTFRQRLGIWLLRLLLFKLMFQSGAVKLLSGDEAWQGMMALTRHYETQPLPTWIGWYAHQLPTWCHRGSCWVMFFIELVVPFLILAPRRPRQLAAACFALLQLTILLTGNYTFFNWLTLALCLPLLDDFALRRFVPARQRDRIGPAVQGVACRRCWLALTAAVLVAALYLAQVVWMFRVQPAVLAPMAALRDWVAPFRTFNSYGLFAVMTMTRPEIVIEGSDDGVHWVAYEFPYKPGNVNRRPPFVAPHQPRLDWQMWFAALGRYQGNPWLVQFCGRLMEGEPSVLALLDANPFPEHPPRYVRAKLYEYHFTDMETRAETGAWWWREEKGLYMPILSRRP